MPDDGVGSGEVVACQRESIRTLETVGETGEKAIFIAIAFRTIRQVREDARFQLASPFGLSSRRTPRFGPPAGS
jgi:hypothetical protein